VHLDGELIRLHHGDLGAFWLATGVDIFFVISGFIMWTSVERRGRMTASEFLRNRIIRIVPLYWLVSTFVVCVLLVAPQTARTAALEPIHAVASFLFLPARHPTTGRFWPIIVAGWSLNYEMLFYIIFAASIKFSDGKRTKRFALIFILLLIVFLLGRLFQSSIDVMEFYASPITAEFMLGIILAIIYQSKRAIPSFTYLVLVPIGFFLLWAASHLAIWPGTTGVGAALVVAGAVLAPPIKANPLSRLGDASYSLYLTHGIVLSALAWLCERLYPDISPILLVSVGLFAAITLAFITYNRLELPTTRLLKQLWTSRNLQESADRKLAGQSVAGE